MNKFLDTNEINTVYHTKITLENFTKTILRIPKRKAAGPFADTPDVI